MEVRYSNFEVDERIYGKDDLCGLIDLDGNYIYKNFYSINTLLINSKLSINNVLKITSIRKHQLYLNMFNDFELKEELKKRKVKTLASSELLKISIIKACITPEIKVIFLDNIDAYLTDKDLEIVLKTLKNYKEQINKNIIFSTNKIDNIIKYCDNYLISENDKLIFNDKDITKMPIKTKIMNFVDLANSKGAKLSYYKDSSDLLKAIYRSVKK